jgi:hypothetical protein
MSTDSRLSGAAPLDMEIAEARARRANLRRLVLFQDTPAPETAPRAAKRYATVYGNCDYPGTASSSTAAARPGEFLTRK